MWEYKTPKTGVPLEVLHKKPGVGPQLHLFSWSRVLAVWQCKTRAKLQNWERSSPKHPLSTILVIDRGKAILGGYKYKANPAVTIR
jgi:hypothetical protein